MVVSVFFDLMSWSPKSSYSMCSYIRNQRRLRNISGFSEVNCSTLLRLLSSYSYFILKNRAFKRKKTEKIENLKEKKINFFFSYQILYFCSNFMMFSCCIFLINGLYSTKFISNPFKRPNCWKTLMTSIISVPLPGPNSISENCFLSIFFWGFAGIVTIFAFSRKFTHQIPIIYKKIHGFS